LVDTDVSTKLYNVTFQKTIILIRITMPYTLVDTDVSTKLYEVTFQKTIILI